MLDIHVHTPTPTAADMEVLVQAKKVIQSPERWTKGCTARDIAGRPCSPDSADAVRYSVLGALSRATLRLTDPSDANHACRKLGERLASKLGHHLPRRPDGLRVALDLIVAYNDIATHQAVKCVAA